MTAEEIGSTAFETLFDVLNTNVQEVTLSDGSTATLQRDGGGDNLYWMGAFPTRVIYPEIEDNTSSFEYGDTMQRDAYPMGVIPNPEENPSKTGFRLYRDRVEFEVTIVSVKSEVAQRLKDKVKATIRKNAEKFIKEGYYDVDLEASSANMSHHGDMKLHVYTIPVEMYHETKVDV